MKETPKSIGDIQVGDYVGILEREYSSSLNELKVHFIESQTNTVFVTDKYSSYIRRAKFTDIVYVIKKKDFLKNVLSWIKTQLK